MLIDYLGNVSIWKRKIGNNEYGEPVFVEKEIACRLVEKFKEVTDEKGNKVVSSGVIQCVESIRVGDYINDKRIVAVNSMTSLDDILGYRGYLL